MKKILIPVLLAFLAISCDDGQEYSNAKITDRLRNDTASVQIAVLPTMDCLPILVASERGIFERENMHVGIRYYKSQMDCDTALLRGWANVMVTDLVRAEYIKDQDEQLTYLTSTDAYWQLQTVRTARIHRLSQLDDKMLAMTRYSVTDMLGDYLVDSAGLAPERVFRVQVNDLDVRLGMLQTGIMDALLLPEPQATLGHRANTSLLFDTRQAGIRMGVIVAKDKSLDNNEISVFQKVYNEACDSINERGLHNYSQLLEDYYGLTEADIDSLPGDLKFSHTTAPFSSDVNRAKNWLEKKKIEHAEADNIR